MDKVSFTSAGGELPLKLINTHPAIRNGFIRPFHLQLIPTNHCNANCLWCSCKNVDRKLELHLDEIKKLLAYFHRLGTRAITITGGGEPTIHPNINDILVACYIKNIHIGLVTNGIAWGKETNLAVANQTITWLRISVVNNDPSNIETICRLLPNVDCGISFTVVDNVDTALVKEVCKIADAITNITHIRFVSDIINPDPDIMRLVKNIANSPKAIFQDRSVFTRGMKECRISLLKPTVDADGFVYPCCGVQYALNNDSRIMPIDFRMCHWTKFHETKMFDGGFCKKCYYEHYNRLLAQLTKKVTHERFV